MKARSKARKAPNRRATVIPDCKHFTGYKPCFPSLDCLEECVDPHKIGVKILIVNLEAMGNVLVTTTLLAPIKRKYPASSVYWITLINAAHLLDHNPYLDRVFVWEPEAWLKLQSMRFDIVMNIDKSVHACAFTMSLQAGKKLGYGLNPDGKIVPLNREAEHNYRLGLNDFLKFRANQKSNSQLLTETMGLKYRRDEYVMPLSEEERGFCDAYKSMNEMAADDLVVGFNTGCSAAYPNKKLTVDQHIILIRELSKREGVRLVLLGGPEDTERNAEIVRQAGEKVLSTPTTEGLRRGICYENICDVIITGDSLGMHVGIALKKYIIVWFGVSCPPEVDLFDRGVKLIPEGLACSPCWKQECPYDLECMQVVDLDGIVGAVERLRFMPRAAVEKV